MKNILTISTLVSILLAGALFGFFYTLSISIMPGLDLTEPYSAIVANQAIGRASQNTFFTLALLGTPLSLIISLILTWLKGNKIGGYWFGAALVAFIAMVIVTATLNVPLNQVLDAVAVTPQQSDLQQIWEAYSTDWQRWNWLRVLFSGLTLLFASIALQRNAANWS